MKDSNAIGYELGISKTNMHLLLAKGENPNVTDKALFEYATTLIGIEKARKYCEWIGCEFDQEFPAQ